MQRHTRVAVAAGTVLLFVSACSSSPSASWETGKDVLDGMSSAGFDCAWPADASGDQVTTIDPSAGAAGGTVVQCEGFSVLLFDSTDAMLGMASENCTALTAEERQSPDFTAPIVRGPNFIVTGAGDAAAFPANAQPQDFTKAFGGDVITVIDFYDEACGDTPPAPPASSAAPTATSAPE